MPKVSVIIPSLNSMKYLRECMESVVNQTLHDIEIIPVDAGSTDGTWELFQEYAAKDPRVKPLHSDRKSTGYQDNIGIKAATGKYVAIVETDDYIELDMYETLYNKAEENNVDWIRSDFYYFIEIDGVQLPLETRLFPDQCNHLYGRVINPREHRSALSTLFKYIWNGIYRRDFLMKYNIRQNETPGASFQDNGFANQVLMYGERVLYIRQPFYHYRRDNENASAYRIKPFQFIIDEFEFLLNCIETNREQVEIWLPYLCSCTIRSFDFWLTQAQMPAECPPDIRIKIAEFIDLVRRGFDLMHNCQQSWDKNIANNNLIFLMNDVDQYYTQMYWNKTIKMRMFNHGLNMIRPIPQLIIFGAGECGVRSYIHLRKNDINSVVCFCDNDKNKEGSELFGLPIISLNAAKKRYPDAVYLVASLLYDEEMINQLQKERVDSRNIINLCTYLPSPGEVMSL